MPHDTLESLSTKGKSGVASWVLLYCECRFNLTTTTIMFVMMLQLKSHFQREVILFVKVNFRKKELVNVCMLHQKVFFETWLSKATFERKLSDVSGFCLSFWYV